MTTRKAVGIANFNHVMDHVLGKDDTSNLKICLKENGINDIQSLISLNGKTIDTLQYKDSNNNGVIIKINLGDKNIIRSFLHYIQFLAIEGNQIKK